MLQRPPRHRPRGGPALRLRGQSSRVGRRPRTHALRRLRRALIARYGYLIQEYRLTPDGTLPALRDAGARALERRSSRPAHLAPFLPGTIRTGFQHLSGQRHNDPDVPSSTRIHSARCATCACRSPTAATCAAATACRRTDYVWLPREDILHFEEIERLVDVFIALGVDKVRLTGGEPLLRRDLPTLVAHAGRASPASTTWR